MTAAAATTPAGALKPRLTPMEGLAQTAMTLLK